jgi:signal transduction histidine kinase
MDIASGNLNARIATQKKDELGKLAETINHMGSELSKIDQLRKDLIANVSHELRTPLSLIKGYAETIRDISGSNEIKREEQIGIIIEEADRLSGIVEDILNLSQMQAGYFPVMNGRFNLYDTLEKVKKRYELLSEKNDIQFTVGSISTDLFIWGDEVKIEQVLYNLINNAFNHTKAGGHISVDVQDMGEQIRLSIKDTGEGISKGELPYIWERFYKKDGSGGRKAAGTGLGLAIVKNILDIHGARYGVESEPGKGSDFWFELKKE